MGTVIMGYNKKKIDLNKINNMINGSPNEINVFPSISYLKYSQETQNNLPLASVSKPKNEPKKFLNCIRHSTSKATKAWNVGQNVASCRISNY